MAGLTVLPDPASARRLLIRTPLFLAITAGRTGSKLLSTLLAECLGVQSEHEATPRLNYVLRGIQAAPDAAGWWLKTEKLPAIAARLDGRPYADISHLYAKGFVEPLIDLGLRPGFFLLSRPASEVATSHVAIDCVPQRTAAGRLVLVGPGDPGTVAPLPEVWQGWTDHQMCYWYAREMERRQDHYRSWLPAQGCEVIDVAMSELVVFEEFSRIADFVARVANTTRVPDRTRFDAIVAVNQNPRARVAGRSVPTPGPTPDRDAIAAQEWAVDAALAVMAET